MTTETTAQDNYADSLHKAGLITKETAAVMKQTPPTIVNRGRSRVASHEKVVEDYERGLTQREVGLMHDISQGHVSNILKKHYKQAKPQAQADDQSWLIDVAPLLDKIVATINQHADDGNADQKRIVELELHVSELLAENKLLWKRLDGINEELNAIDSLPPPSQWSLACGPRCAMRSSAGPDQPPIHATSRLSGGRCSFG